MYDTGNLTRWMATTIDGGNKHEWHRDMHAAVAEIERLRAALQRVDALNDNPARFNSEINEVVMQALEPSSHQ